MLRKTFKTPWSEEDLLNLYNLFWKLSRKEQDDQFWTPKQVADTTGRHPSNIRRLANENRLPAIRVFGTEIRIHVPTLLNAYSTCSPLDRVQLNRLKDPPMDVRMNRTP